MKDTALPASTKIIDTKASKQNQGRVFGGRFNDGLSNAVDGISMTRSDQLNSLQEDVNPLAWGIM